MALLVWMLVTIKLSFYSKAKARIRKNNSTVSFDYDPMGHRIAKHVSSSNNQLGNSTYYILDAQGNTMSIYNRKVNTSTQSVSYTQTEKHIYGSSRLGILNDSVNVFGSAYVVGGTPLPDGVLDLSSIQTVAPSELCTSNGKWAYEVGGTTGNAMNNIATFTDNTPTFGAMSAQFVADVIPGQTYTFSFELVNTNNIGALNYEIRECTGTIYENIGTNGNKKYETTFMVPTTASNKLRIKFLAFEQTDATMSFSVSNIFIDGPGVQFTANAAGGSANVSKYHSIGKRTYELTNHLGNVLSVISDKPIPNVTGSTVNYYMAYIRQSTDYSAFGVQLNGRNFTKAGAKEFRYGFNDMEADDEIKGNGNSYTTEFRQYDPRLGRWLTIDPVTHSWQSTYCAMDNNPVRHTDKSGSTIDPSSKETFDGHKKATNDRLNELTKQRDKLLNKGKDNHPSLNYINESISQLNDALKELDEMEATDKINYTIVMTNESDPKLTAIKANGLTEANGKQITILATDRWNLGHELKHGYQHLIGELDEFNITHDYQDEIDGFKRGFAYSPYSSMEATGYSYFDKDLILKYYLPGTNYAVSEKILKMSDQASVVIQFTASVENQKVLQQALILQTELKKKELIDSGVDPTEAASQAASMTFEEFLKRAL